MASIRIDVRNPERCYGEAETECGMDQIPKMS